jgi:hypothetical protein
MTIWDCGFLIIQKSGYVECNQNNGFILVARIISGFIIMAKETIDGIRQNLLTERRINIEHVMCFSK